jgi:hypothetical protein
MNHIDDAERYRELHDALDELAAAFIGDTEKRLSKATVMELMQWSFNRVKKAEVQS